MKRTHILKTGAHAAFAAALFSVVAVCAFAAPGSKAKPATTSRFEQLKALAGDWAGTAVHEGKPIDVAVNFKVTAAQSAVVETEFPGTDHEMMTIITKDGDQLALMHYCAMGNQPHMKAPDQGEGNALAFKFTGGGSMKSEKDAHMHSVTYTFVDKNTLKADWSHFANGKMVGSVVMNLKRKQ
jgi:hypothetical protein